MDVYVSFLLDNTRGAGLTNNPIQAALNEHLDISRAFAASSEILEFLVVQIGVHIDDSGAKVLLLSHLRMSNDHFQMIQVRVKLVHSCSNSKEKSQIEVEIICNFRAPSHA